MTPSAPLRLLIDRARLADNWRALRQASGTAACGAAVKADGYGLGASGVVDTLVEAGCRDFFVAIWAEADAIAARAPAISVLHGVREEDMAAALASPAHVRPVLNTVAQVMRWRDGAGDRPCDVMVDTGMNRLGLSPADVSGGLLDGLTIETLMSHLACADEPGHAMNERQRAALAGLAGRTAARRLSLANSAGIALGASYGFDLTRPGLALYGGVPCAGLEGAIRSVATIEAQVLQRRSVRAGEGVGYNATWIAPADAEVAIVNLGYADGYCRGFSDRGHAFAGDVKLPVIGRVSMDLVALDVTAAAVGEGDWVRIAYDLPAVARASGMSQYELLTGLGGRFGRVWA